MKVRGEEFAPPAASFRFGQEVRVRVEEAGEPPEFAAVVVAIEMRGSARAVEYTVMDERGSRWDGYGEDWLRAAPIGGDGGPRHAPAAAAKPADPVAMLREIEAYLSFKMTGDPPSVPPEEIRSLRRDIGACLRAGGVDPATGGPLARGDRIDVTHLVCPVIGAPPSHAAAVAMPDGTGRLPSFRGSPQEDPARFRSSLFGLGLSGSVRLRPEPLLVAVVGGEVHAWLLGSATPAQPDADIVAAPISILAINSPAPAMLRDALAREWPGWSAGAEASEFPAAKASAGAAPPEGPGAARSPAGR